MGQILNAIGRATQNTGHSLLTWEWTKKLLHWLIISAGTVSECAFLLASLWMSVNASVHSLVLLAIDDTTAQHITELATAAYVALPELILGLAFVVTIGHVRVWLYNHKDYSAGIWSILYGLPTLIFLVLSLITLGCSVVSVNFRLPEPLVVVRALAGYMFAFTSLLYTQLGIPQERDRLQKKDDLLATLRQEKDGIIVELESENVRLREAFQQERAQIIAQWESKTSQLQQVIAQQNAAMEEQKMLLSESKNAQSELLKALNKSSESALTGYSEECITWLKSGVKTVSIEDITRFSGHSKRKIANAITAGMLQTAPRNKDLILVSSLVEWLKVTPAPGTKTEQGTGAMEAITDSLKVITPAMMRQESGAHNGNNHYGMESKAG